MSNVWSTHDSARRLTSVNGQKTGEPNRTYESQFSYSPHGALKYAQLGNGRWEHTDFNNRLQPTLIGVGTSNTDSSLLKLEYTYSNSNPSIHDNNGNVLTQKITAGGSVYNQTYSYDAMNRLSSAAEAGWSENCAYDRYGNMWVSSCTGITLSALTPQSQSAFNNSNNNRLAAPNQYDPAGNLIIDALNRSFGYDAENRQKDFNNSAVRYIYDGDGRRVEKIEGPVTTVFVYNVAAQLVAEYTSGTPEVGGGTTYLSEDHLGSVRLTMQGSGDVKSRHDYLPFGEELSFNRSASNGYVTDNLRQKFTQKERDTESGLDVFETRYYSSAQGRFTSPDSYLIILEKQKGKDENEREQILREYISQPQVWNKYVYVLNNPLKHIDPDGRRELTAEDQKRLQILWDEYYKAKASTDPQINSELAPAIIGAISEILSAIKDVVEGDADPPNLRAVEFAIDNIGNTNYGDRGTVSNGVTRTVTAGQNKCNIFCANAYAQGGGVGFGGAGVPVNTTFFGRKYPPAANDLANPSTPIKNFEVVTTRGLGDIAAFPARIGLGHSAIYAGGGAAIYASTNNVKIQTVQYVLTAGSGHAFVTYRSLSEK